MSIWYDLDVSRSNQTSAFFFFNFTKYVHICPVDCFLILLLLESLHYFRPMLGAGSSSGMNSSRSSWVRGCGRMGQTSMCFIVCSSPHSHAVHHFTISALGLCIVQSLSGDELGLTRCAMPHSNLEVAIPWGWRRACVVWFGYGWTRGSVFECGCCHQGFQQCGGSCVLIWVSFWLDVPHREDAEIHFLDCVSQPSWDEAARLICGGNSAQQEYMSSTLVGLSHSEMALHAAVRTGSIFDACDDLLQTKDAYSAEEKHRVI